MRTSVIFFSAVWLATVASCASSSRDEPSQGPGLAPTGDDPELVAIRDFSFVGAFALPTAQDSVSSLDFAAGIIEVNGDSLFIAGHDHQDAIAEFTVPQLVNSNRISDLQIASAPRQGFVRVLDRAAAGNPESLDKIMGIELVDGRLFVNAVEFYDAPADNRLSTLIIDNASDLKSSSVSEFRSMEGYARAAGWISAIPQAWRSVLGGSHISGHSSGGPIIARHSVGPSAFAVDFESEATNSNSRINTTELLGFSLDRPLNEDLFNESRQNSIWTHLSQARYGFVIPGTRTYATIGWSGGHQSGVGYKITQNNGNLCGGYCSYAAEDNYNFYWLWDMDDLEKAERGSIHPDNITPYEYGRFELPFQTDAVLNPIGGASFDASRNLLYISLLKANNEVGEFHNPPVVVAYKINR